MHTEETINDPLFRISMIVIIISCALCTRFHSSILVLFFQMMEINVKFTLHIVELDGTETTTADRKANRVCECVCMRQMKYKLKNTAGKMRLCECGVCVAPGPLR